MLLALVATGIDGFFKIGTLGDAPFWKVLIYYVILFVLIEAVRVGIQKCIEKRDGKKEKSDYTPMLSFGNTSTSLDTQRTICTLVLMYFRIAFLIILIHYSKSRTAVIVFYKICSYLCEQEHLICQRKSTHTSRRDWRDTPRP